MKPTKKRQRYLKSMTVAEREVADAIQVKMSRLFDFGILTRTDLMDSFIPTTEEKSERDLAYDKVAIMLFPKVCYILQSQIRLFQS